MGVQGIGILANNDKLHFLFSFFVKKSFVPHKSQTKVFL